MQESSFETWFAKNVTKCNKIYEDMAPKFRKYVYNHLKQQHISCKHTATMDEMIDVAFKNRLGLTDSLPCTDNATVTGVLENLVYGDSIPKHLMTEFVNACIEQNVDKMLIKQIKHQCVCNANTQYDHL